MRRTTIVDQPAGDESPLVPFLRVGPPPDRTTCEGWQQWRLTRDSFIPAPRLSLAEYQALSPRGRALNDLHRTATHVNLRLQETPMSVKVAGLMRGRLQNNAVKFMPGTRDGLMINGGGFQGKTETACSAAAAFEDLWRDIYQQLLPGHTPGTRDLFVPVAYCRLPGPGDAQSPVQDHPGCLRRPPPRQPGRPDPLGPGRGPRPQHHRPAHRRRHPAAAAPRRRPGHPGFNPRADGPERHPRARRRRYPGSGLLRGAYVDPRTNQWVFPHIKHGKSHSDAAATQTERRFDLVDLDPFDYITPAGITAFLEHLAGIEDQLRLLRSSDGMLTSGGMPEYLFRRTHGIVGLLRRLIEDGCAKAIATGEERLTTELLASTAIRLGNLADLDPEAGEIPEIPRDVQPSQPPRKKNKRSRNTVFDDHAGRSAVDE
jgi:hypothetical protein